MWCDRINVLCETSDSMEFLFFATTKNEDESSQFEKKYTKIHKQKEKYVFVRFQNQILCSFNFVCGTFASKICLQLVANDHFKPQTTFLHFIKIESGFFHDFSFGMMMMMIMCWCCCYFEQFGLIFYSFRMR